MSDIMFGEHSVELLYVIWTYGRTVTEVGFSTGLEVLTDDLRTCHICVILYPFSLNMVLGNSNSSWRLSLSHGVLAVCTKVERRACKLEGWFR